jgi:inner membrane protein
MQRTLLFKCLLLAMLVVLLIIPLSMIEHTIAERSSYRDQAVNAIAASSAGRQVLAGPVLTIPVEEEYDEEVVPGKNGASAYGVVRRKRTLMVTLLPKNLELKGGLKAERRAYGIHSAAVFDMHVALSGSFDPPTAADVPNRGRNSLLTWGTPRLVVGISDVRGLVSEPKLRAANANLVGVRGTQPTNLNSGFHADLPAAGMPTHAIPFSAEFDLVGTESFGVVPLADLTDVELQGNWADPSFGGSFLPRERQVGKQGFQAHWTVSALAANVQRDSLVGSRGNGIADLPAFNVRLIDPVDIYHQSLRAVKYGILFVVVIFAAFFAIETIGALPIHPIQYLLVGLALALFFLLLVSLSEHLAFAWAYLIAAFGSVGLIVAYLQAVLRSAGRAAGVGGALILLYGALFGVLQSEQNALLLGSLLLFAILATLMLGTRNVDWYRFGPPQAEAQ